MSHALTNIRWASLTWTVVTGCTKISALCKYCYAKIVATMKIELVDKYMDGFKVKFHEDEISLPHKITKGMLIFLTSMGDIFHTESQPDFVLTLKDGSTRIIPGGQLFPEQIKRIFETMHLAKQHIFQVLTKRLDNLIDLQAKSPADFRFAEHMWLGTSVGDKHTLKQIPKLQQIDVQIRFLSMEPLLSALPELEENLAGISWVICGGESYAKRPEPEELEKRQMRVEWAIEIKEICRKKNVAFFFKQYSYIGSHKPHHLLPDLTVAEYLRKIDEMGLQGASEDEKIKAIGNNPDFFNALEFSEMPTPEAQRMYEDTEATRQAKREQRQARREIA